MTCPSCHSAEIEYETMVCPFCSRKAKESERQAFLASLPAPYREKQEQMFELALREAG